MAADRVTEKALGWIVEIIDKASKPLKVISNAFVSSEKQMSDAIERASDDVNNYEKKMEKATSAVGKLAKVARDVTDEIKELATSREFVSAFTTIAVTKEANRFDRDMAHIRVELGKSARANQAWEEQALRARTKWAMNEEDMIELMGQAAEWGIKGEAFDKWIESTNKMSVVSRKSATEVGTLGRTLAKELGMGYDKLSNVYSAVTFSAQNSSLSIGGMTEKIIESLPLLRALQARGGDVGKSVADLSATYAVLGDNFSNVISTMFAKMPDLKDWGERQKELSFISQRTGMSARDLRGMVQNLDYAGLAKQMALALRTFDPNQLSQMESAVGEMIGLQGEGLVTAVSQLRTNKDLAVSFDDMRKAVSGAYEKGTQLNSAWSLARGSLEGLVKILKNSFVPVLVEIGTPLANILKTLFGFLSWFIQSVSLGFMKLPVGLRRVIGALITAVGVFAMLRVVMLKVAVAMKALGLISWVTTSLNPMLLVIMAVAAAILLIVGNWGVVVKGFKTGIVWIRNAWASLVEFFARTGQIIAKPFLWLHNKFAGAVGKSIENYAGFQGGGLISHPSTIRVAEHGIPEYVIPAPMLKGRAGPVTVSSAGGSKISVSPAVNVDVHQNEVVQELTRIRDLLSLNLTRLGAVKVSGSGLAHELNMAGIL